jgi:hypothetical protein
MTRITFSQLIAGALVSLCLATAPAWALNDHTYVSEKGADTGICTTPATACRTFAFAIGQTAASGTIIAIDAANYGPVTINKSISIVADGGGPAGIFITTGNAISIITGATVVNLRGLTLDGAGTAGLGISDFITTGSNAVTITDCFIRNFSSDGINLSTTSATQSFHISNTVSANNKGSGLLVSGESAETGVVDHFTADGDSKGIDVVKGVFLVSIPDVTIVDSVITNNVSDGLLVGGGLGGGSATVRLGGSVVKGNVTGVNISAGSFLGSYGDNEIDGNTTDVTGTLTPLAKK